MILLAPVSNGAFPTLCLVIFITYQQVRQSDLKLRLQQLLVYSILGVHA